jgi:hypothetical protein
MRALVLLLLASSVGLHAGDYSGWRFRYKNAVPVMEVWNQMDPFIVQTLLPNLRGFGDLKDGEVVLRKAPKIPELMSEEEREKWVNAERYGLSLRGEFDSYELSVAGSSKEDPSSCVLLSVKTLLEILWSRAEERKVNLSLPYLMWAYDQTLKEMGVRKHSGSFGSVNIMLEAVGKYGAAEAHLYSKKDKSPSEEAMKNAMQRRNLVVREIAHAPKEDFTTPLLPLMIDELRKKRPLLYSGSVPVHADFSNPLMSFAHQTEDITNHVPHSQPLIGFKFDTDFKGMRAYNGDYLFEVRQVWGKNYGDNGHGWMPFESMVYGRGYVYSLSLD